MDGSSDLVQKVLRHDRAERLPRGELFVDAAFTARYAGAAGDDEATRLAEAARLLGLDLVGVDLNRGGAREALAEGALRRLASEFFSVACINGPFTRLVARLGFREAMLVLKTHPDLLAQAASALAREMDDLLPDLARNGFRGIAVTDDIAGAQGPFFSPRSFGELLGPSYAALCGRLHREKISAFYHSDGQMRSIVPYLLDAGFDCLHPVEAQAGMDLYRLRDDFGGRICFMGHVEIMSRSPEQIRREIDRAEEVFRCGGLIIGSATGISLESAGPGLAALYPAFAAVRP